MIRHASVVGPLLVCALTSGCGDPAQIPLEVRVYGEELIEEKLPATLFHDGWSVEFEHFLVALHDVSVAKGHGAAVLSEPAARVFDLAQPSLGEPKGVLVAQRTVARDSFDHVGYRIGPVGAGAAPGNALPPGALAAMTAGNESVRVGGSATRAGKTIRFDWGFTSNTRHTCHADIAPAAGGARAEITIHGDHLFHDDLVAAEPNLAFDLIAAADADADGRVTREELAAKDITKEARYQVGNFAVKDLWAFLAHLVMTIGHVQGEGHCGTTAL